MTSKNIQEVVLENDDKQNVVDNESMTDIITLIETHRQNAYKKVNEELVALYYEMGGYISNSVKNKKWGSKAIDEISTNIKRKYPTMKGFGRTNIYLMVLFYNTYMDNIIVQKLSGQISWSNNMLSK